MPLKPGSSLYYSFSQYDQKTQIALANTSSWFHEILSIQDKCTQPEIADQRYQWWRGEIHRLYLGSPEHPITQSLQESINDFSIPKLLLLSLIDGAQTHYYKEAFKDENALIEDAHQNWSLLFIIWANILGAGDKANLNYAKDLGVIAAKAYYLKRLPLDLKRRTNFLPHTYFLKQGVEANLLSQAFSNPEIAKKIQKVFSDYFICSEKNLVQVKNEQSDPRLSRIALYTQLQLESCRILSKKALTKVIFPLDLSPLKKLWIAWKNRT